MRGEFAYRSHEAHDRQTRPITCCGPYIKNGTVLFPRSGCEQLLGQMFNLGVESTTTGLIQGLVSQGLELPKINSIETWPPNWEIRAQRESPLEFRMLFPPLRYQV